tara:strand:+ start:2164 stop:2427 length:264 start_codon:yes stop_codon:yes gene_type:complete
MGKHKLSINNPKNRFRRRILEFASTVEKFNIHQLIDWYYDNYPKDVPNRNKLNGYLPIINFLEKVGYATYGRKTNMEYKLRDEYVVD